MSPDTLEIVRCALQSVYETGGTIEEQALIEQSDHISELVAENAKLREAAQAVVKAKAKQEAGIHTAYHTGIAIDALAALLEGK